MTRTRRFLGGIGYGYAYQLLVTLAGLWLTPFLLRWMGQRDLGLWFVGAQVVTYLTLLDFGVVALLPRDASLATGRALANGPSEELPVIIGQTTRLVLWQMPLVIAAAIAIWLSMPAEWEPLRAPLALVFVVFVVTFPFRVFQATLQGLQDLEFLGKTQICIWALSTVITVALVFAKWGLYALAVGWVVTQVLTSAVALSRAKRRFAEHFPREFPPLPWPAARKRLGSGVWASVNQIATILVIGTDVIIVGKLLGPAAVVPFVCTSKLIMVLANQPQLLMQTALPALAQLRGSERHEHLSDVCSALNQAMLIVSGGVVCVVLAANKGFVSWWVGAELYGGFLLTAFALLSMLLRHWTLTIGIVLFSFGFERRVGLTALLDGVVTVASTVLFVWFFGLTVAPLGSVVGVCLISLPLNLSCIAVANRKLLPKLLRSLGPWFWRFALLAALSAIFARFVVPNTFPALAATAIGIGVVYSAVMFQLSWRDPLGVYVRPRLSPLATRFFRALPGRSSSTAA